MRSRARLAGIASLAATLILLVPAGRGLQADSQSSTGPDTQEAPLRVPSDPSAAAVCKVTPRQDAVAAIAALKTRLARERAEQGEPSGAAAPLNSRGYGYAAPAPLRLRPAPRSSTGD